MFLWWLLCEIRDFLSSTNDRKSLIKNNSHLDIFMGLFMLCAIEVVIMKIMFFYDESERILTAFFSNNDDEENSH